MKNERLDRLIAEQSSEWIGALNRGNGENNPAFAEWLLDSKRHVRVFLLASALDRELEHFDPERRHAVPPLQKAGAEIIPLDETLADTSELPPLTEDAPAEHQELTPAHRKQKRPLATFGVWSVAAVFLAALAVLIALNQSLGFFSGWKQYSTAVGEQRVIELQDGSTVRLNTQSRIAVRLSEHTRDIRLISGEAIFKVHHDTARPFRVHTLGAFIQAVGTEFNVYRRADRTKVAVLEGRVQISSGSAPDTFAVAPATSSNSGSAGTAEINVTTSKEHSEPNAARSAPKATTFLSAGEEAEIDKGGHVADAHHADVARVSAWSERRLVFKQESLAEIVTQFNRYNRSPRFTVVGTSIAERRYSGAFNADDPQSLRALLAGEPDLVVEQHNDEIVIRARPQSRTADAIP